MHSNYSDGIYKPKELIDLAMKKGLCGIAITDHDTIDGLKEGESYAREKNFLFINGIEFSTFIMEKEVHILGYKIDYYNKGLTEITKKLKKSREERGLKIIEKLNNLGIKIESTDLYHYPLKSIGRPHIANILIEKGYVKNKQEAFLKYIGQDCSGYVEKYKLLAKEAIQIIKDAGGIAIIAHPHLIQEDRYVEMLLDMGIDGIEVYHSKHSLRISDKYKYIAKKRNLYITGGSDFHGYKEDFNFLGKVGIKREDLKFI